MDLHRAIDAPTARGKCDCSGLFPLKRWGARRRTVRNMR